MRCTERCVFSIGEALPICLEVSFEFLKGECERSNETVSDERTRGECLESLQIE